MTTAARRSGASASLPGGPTSIQRLDNGNTLIACTEGAQIVEIDLGEKDRLASYRSKAARSMPAGSTTAARWSRCSTARRSSSSTPPASQSGRSPASAWPSRAERLESGTTLVCAIGVNQVREFDSSGNVVWAQGKFANPYTAQRLASGNTVVVDTTGVTEIDPQGTTVFRLEMPNLSRMWRY